MSLTLTHIAPFSSKGALNAVNQRSEARLHRQCGPQTAAERGIAALELRWDAVTLFRYIYEPDMPQSESPKPYFHPIRTLAGDLITNYRPHDHLWHKGIQMTIAHLDDQNFWGGGSYRHGQGYVQLSNNGSQRHDSWESIEVDDNSFSARQKLSWITQAGEHWIDETRCIAVDALDPDAGYWALDFSTALRNVKDVAPRLSRAEAHSTLHIGSPTTEGRPLAGYGGLFWRGPRSFDQGKVITAAGHEGPAAMGQPAAWLAYTGHHDGSGNTSTLAFLDHPSNLRYPNKWFVRQTPYACASFAFMFDEVYALQAGDTLTLRYRIVIASGGWNAERIEPLAAAWQASGG